MALGLRWLIGMLSFSALGATWGFLGNGYEPGDSAIGTGIMGAALGLVVGAVGDAVGYAKKSRRP